MYEALINHRIPENELKPGDLIFYTATYKDEEKQPKRNGVVHVEIFLGHSDPTWYLFKVVTMRR
jgi:hypothetical protein